MRGECNGMSHINLFRDRTSDPLSERMKRVPTGMRELRKREMTGKV